MQKRGNSFLYFSLYSAASFENALNELSESICKKCLKGKIHEYLDLRLFLNH